MDYRERFKSCGDNVIIEANVYFEHPERIEVGNNVRFQPGFYMQGEPQLCRFGDNIIFAPNCFIEGWPGRLIIGDDVQFYPGNYLAGGENADAFIEIGPHSHFAPGCVLYGGGGLTIGPHCNVAAHAVFATVQHDHAIITGPMSETYITGPITLEEDVWIAANVTIARNTRIARGCVIGANSVVLRDTEPMGIYAGVPARRLRDRQMLASAKTITV